jgi:hypothetical protein
MMKERLQHRLDGIYGIYGIIAEINHHRTVLDELLARTAKQALMDVQPEETDGEMKQMEERQAMMSQATNVRAGRNR